MATAWFGPCPHCKIALSYLEGVTGSTMHPLCPQCRKEVSVSSATFLMVDTSRRRLVVKNPLPPRERPTRTRGAVTSSSSTKPI